MTLEPRHTAEILAILAERAPGATVVAFGSRVTGGARPWSDLDLAVFGDAPLTLRALGRLRDAFEESTLPFRVDVCDGLRLPADLVGHVRSRGEIVTGSQT